MKNDFLNSIQHIIDMYNGDINMYSILLDEINNDNRVLHLSPATKVRFEDMNLRLTEEYYNFNIDMIKPLTNEYSDFMSWWLFKEDNYNWVNELCIQLLKEWKYQAPIPIDKFNTDEVLKQELDNIYPCSTPFDHIVQKEIKVRVLEILQTIREICNVKYYFIDTESLGLEENSDLVQVALLETDSNLNIVKGYNWYIKRNNIDQPLTPTQQDAVNINKLTDEFMNTVKCTEIKQALTEIYSILKNQIVIGHNVRFDTRIINYWCKTYNLGRLDCAEICTYLNRSLFGKLKNYKLSTIVSERNTITEKDTYDLVKYSYGDAYTLNPEDAQAHNAMWDTVLVYSLIKAYPNIVNIY